MNFWRDLINGWRDLVIPIVVALFLAMIVFSLVGCATAPGPQVVVSKVEALPPVRIPVLVPCLEANQIPEIPTTPNLDTLTDWQVAVMARRKLLEWSAYAAKADSLLVGCVKPEPEAPK